MNSVSNDSIPNDKMIYPVLTDEKADVDLADKKADPVLADKKADPVSIDIPESNETKPRKKKSAWHIILCIFGWMFLAFFILILIYIIFTVICNIIDNERLKNFDEKYAKKVEVNGRLMSYNIVGENNNQTIVIVPRFGSPSPILEYKPIAEALSDKYKVITIEPFGYGFSDSADNRTAENIASEYRDCTKKLGVDQYYVMGHSTGGLYSLQWASSYSNEILGVIGMERVTPGIKEVIKDVDATGKYTFLNILRRLGFFRVTVICSSSSINDLDESYEYTDDERSIQRLLISNRVYSDTVLNESRNIGDDLRNLEGIKYPDNIPVLDFIGAKLLKKHQNLKEIYERSYGNNIHNEIVELDGKHKIHLKHKNDIVNKVKEWIN